MSWEERYKTGDTPWDKGAPAPPLLDLLADSSTPFGTGQILVPGCGTGHDVRALAKSLPKAKILGLDISKTALTRAKEVPTKSSASYILDDFLTATAQDYPDVSSVFEHTCFCAIDPSERPNYAEACTRLIPSGGHWIAIIFLTPREVNDPTIGPPFQSSVEEIEGLFGEHFTLTNSYIPEHTYKGREGKELVMIWERK